MHYFLSQKVLNLLPAPQKSARTVEVPGFELCEVPMKKTILVIGILISTAPALASTLDQTHQEKDFEVKKRIYGIRYPWEIIDPYPHVNKPTMDVIMDAVNRSPTQAPVVPNIRPMLPFMVR